MQTRWRIELLGGLRAVQSDRAITRFRSRKTGVLLAYLAYFLPRSSPREELIELLWPESEIDAGRQSLSQSLCSLRHQLEPPGMPAGAVLVTDRASVGLNPKAVITDVAEFDAALRAAARAPGAFERAHALTQAVERYGGLLLAGYGGDWILGERQHLAERYCGALGELIALQEGAGDLNRAIETARRGVRADPLREETQRELIRLLAAAGQAEAALRQYRELERLLRQELGETPEPATRALVRELAARPGGARAGTVRPIGPSRAHLPAGTVTFLLAALESSGDPGDPGRPGTLSSTPAPRTGGGAGDPCSGGGGAALSTAKRSTVPRREERQVCVLPAWEPWAGPRAVSVPQGDPHALLRRLLAQHDGIEVPPVQGAFTAAFSRASDALACAVAGQQALVGCPVSGVGTPLAGALPDAHGHAQEVPLGPYLARMALDTGEVRLQAGTYHGSVLRHAVDMLLAAHAGQILCSEETVALLRRHCPQDVSLADLGLYRFNEKAAPERLFQAEYPEMPRREFPAPQAAVDGSGSLPLQFTRFFGREAELARLTGLLHPVGRPLLLTLTGPGGSGKTRLALEAARRLMEAGTGAQRGCGAIWYVALADLTDGRRIAEAVRDAMRLPRVSGVDPLAQVAAALSRRPSLLLLDNFEHLVTDGAPLLKSLRERVPTLACLVTSRRRLGLAGEREFPVPPLPMPNEGASPEGLARCESVQLFVDRAQAVRPDFQVTRANAAALAALCRRLEGIPLALELAAARAQVLTPAQMLSQMECRFDFLVSRQLRAAARHRTLRGAIDWSYQLLSPALQQFLARLSVFRGGWTLAAAEAVCEASPCGPSRSDGQPLALDYLEQLRECSLVQADEEGGEIRFRMLETLREYAREQLAPEEQAAGEDRHVQFYLALAERAEPELQGPDPGRWLERLEREHDNLRVALEWAVVHREAEVGLRLGGVLWEFWEMRGYFGEGRARLAELLALPPAAEFSAPGRAAALARAKALHGAGALACDQSDYSAARDLLEEALAIWRERGEKIGIAATLHHLADIALYQGHWEEARARYQESLAIHRELGERRGIARSLESLGTLLRKQSDFETARALYEESLKIRREHGNRLEIAVSLWNVGNLALDRGDYATARAFYQESRSVVSELGDRDGVGDALHNLGTVAYYEGDLAAARALFEECLTIRRELGNRRCLAMVLNSLGDVARKRREYEAARALFEESLAIRQALGDEEGIAGSLCSLGALAGCEGNSEVARARCEESLAIRRALGDGRGIIQCLEELAHGAGMSGDAARAARIYGAADAWREAIGLVRPPVDRDGYDQRVAAVRAVLGDDAFRSTWAVGREMTPEQVFADASDDARHD